MSQTKPFFIQQKEFDLINQMNEELIDEIVGQSVDIYKVNIERTEDNLYGEGVNIAARLEALAKPNGICLSKNVHELVNSKTNFFFNDLGEKKVKNTLLHAFDLSINIPGKKTFKEDLISSLYDL